MLIHFGLDSVQGEWASSVVCIGTFDGVHLGHQAVIGEAVRQAREGERPCVLITFDRHPAAIVAPHKKPPAVQEMSGKLAAFERLEVDVAIVLAFDEALSLMSAETFLQEIIIGTLRAEAIVVGHDFGFGRDRVGNAEWLQSRMKTTMVPAFEIDGRRVSSSVIRGAIQEGDVTLAGQLLGRPFGLGGVVVSGEKIGRRLGYPTVNLARASDLVVPGDGVYAGFAETPFGSFRAAISVGMRPAVAGKSRTIEAYLLDYPGMSLYGRTIRLFFMHRLRAELDFASLDDLKEQIARDVEQTAQYVTSPTL